MRCARRLSWLLATLAAVSQAVSPSVLLAQTPVPVQNAPEATSPLASIRDVELGPTGTLVGQVVTPSGEPLSKTRVTIAQAEQQIAETVTDQDGNFQIAGLSGGSYQAQVEDTTLAVRLWVSETAPPNASQAALIVAERTTLLGNLRALSTHVLDASEAIGVVAIVGVIIGGAIILKQRDENDSGS